MLQTISVGIVGVGGLGSHVAQQLAYLGVRKFALIDGDVVSDSNLNRMIGANFSDIGNRKVDVIERVIKAIDANAIISRVPDSFITNSGFEILASSDFVFGCLDHDGPRFVLNEYCQAYEKRYMDLATEIHEEQRAFGGRAFYSTGGEMCLVCKDLLRDEEIRDAFATEEQRREDRRIYGLSAAATLGSGAAVVTLNGVIASLGVTEFMLEVTGIREARQSLEYNGMMGIVTIDRDAPKPDCYYCKGIRGRKDDSGVRRYLQTTG